MNKKEKILFCCMIFVSSIAFCQIKPQQKLSSLLLQQNIKNPLFQHAGFSKMIADTFHAKPFLSPDFYSKQLGFFCKQEIKFDRLTRIPFRFRLGSVDECDRLEGKKKF